MPVVHWNIRILPRIVKFKKKTLIVQWINSIYCSSTQHLSRIVIWFFINFMCTFFLKLIYTETNKRWRPIHGVEIIVKTEIRKLTSTKMVSINVYMYTEIWKQHRLLNRIKCVRRPSKSFVIHSLNVHRILIICNMYLSNVACTHSYQTNKRK